MNEELTSVPTINRLLELAPARTLILGDFTYIDKDKSVTLVKTPVPTAIDIATLSGLVQLLENGFEGFNPTGTVIQVAEFDEVQFMDLKSDQFGRRQVFVKVKALKPERNFTFNQFMAQENFNIALRSMFVETAQLTALLTVSGNLAKELEIRQEDDGFAQRVTVKDGVTLVKEITVNPRVTLQPFRTFLEVDQPDGDFIFRVKHEEGKGNLCALFEADAGGWKLKAMENIKKWLQNSLRGSAVATVNNIPVVA